MTVIIHTIFKDKSDGGNRLAADKHDGIVSGGLGESLGLAVLVQDESTAFIKQLLVMEWDAGPTGQHVLKQCHSVEGNRQTGDI